MPENTPLNWLTSCPPRKSTFCFWVAPVSLQVRWTNLSGVKCIYHSNSPCSRMLHPSLTLCHHSITGWTAGVDTKACYSHYLSFYSGHVIFLSIVRCWIYLPWIQTWPTFKVILSRHQSPVLFPLSFTSPPRDTSVLSRLRTATQFARRTSHTKKYCSFINYALNHYQVSPRNNLTLLFAS